MEAAGVFEMLECTYHLTLPHIPEYRLKKSPPNLKYHVQNKLQTNKKVNVRKKFNTEARSRNHYCRVKAISITCFECVFVALGIQYAKRMPCILLSPAGRMRKTALTVTKPLVVYIYIYISVGCLAVPYFAKLCHKRLKFSKKSE